MEIRARDERRLKLAREVGMSSDEIAELEKQAEETKEKLESEKSEEEKPTAKKVTPKKNTESNTMMSFEDSNDDEDLF